MEILNKLKSAVTAIIKFVIFVFLFTQTLTV